MITLLSIPSAPQFLLSPSLRTFPLLPTLFYLYTPLLSLFAPVSPSHIAWARSDRPPGQSPHLPASTARMRFPPLLGSPRSSLREPVSPFPCLVAPPLTSSTFTIRSLSAPELSCPGVPFFLCLPPPSASPPLPSCWPRPAAHSLAVPGWWSFVIYPPAPCASTSPSLCFAPSLDVF